MRQARSVTTWFLKTAPLYLGLGHLFFAFFLLSASGCAWLDAQQRAIIYRPTPSLTTSFSGLRPGDERYFLAVSSTVNHHTLQRIEIEWRPHVDKTAPTLLYLHGTFRNLFENLHKIEALREAGFTVLAVEYRGWGLSTPITPSEQTLIQDAELAWRELQRREPRATHRVIYGHSMGSGVAVDLASRLHASTDYGALILESAFTSFSDIAREAGFFARLASQFTHERFDSLHKIAHVDAPLLMLHGRLDTTIPVALGLQLFEAARPPKQWVTLEGGAHSNLQDVDHARYQTILKNFINNYLVVPTAEPLSDVAHPSTQRPAP